MNEHLLVAELRRDEGEELTAYLDTMGLWSIGVGHLLDPKRGANPAPFGIDLRNGGAITANQSEALLLSDIKAKTAELDAAIPWWRGLSDARQRALLNMAFNLGVAGLLGFKNTLAAVKAGDYAAASRGMLTSRWASQVGDRAKRLSIMMVMG
jgi:lysozyme